MAKLSTTIKLEFDKDQFDFFNSLFDEIKKNNEMMIEFMEEYKMYKQNMEDDGK